MISSSYMVDVFNFEYLFFSFSGMNHINRGMDFTLEFDWIDGNITGKTMIM